MNAAIKAVKIDGMSMSSDCDFSTKAFLLLHKPIGWLLYVSRFLGPVTPHMCRECLIISLAKAQL